VIHTIEIAIIFMFIYFIIKLCCYRKPKGPRIIKGKRASTSGFAITKKKALNNGSRQTNHRNGLKTQKAYIVD
jgi:hypothetical protein